MNKKRKIDEDNCDTLIYKAARMDKITDAVAMAKPRIRVVLRDGEASANALLLSTASPALKSLLEAPMKEGLEGVVTFPELSEKAFHTVLDGLMLGKFPRFAEASDSELAEVYSFFHMYMMEDEIALFDSEVSRTERFELLIELARTYDSQEIADMLVGMSIERLPRIENGSYPICLDEKFMDAWGKQLKTFDSVFHFMRLVESSGVYKEEGALKKLTSLVLTVTREGAYFNSADTELLVLTFPFLRQFPLHTVVMRSRSDACVEFDEHYHLPDYAVYYVCLGTSQAVSGDVSVEEEFEHCSVTVDKRGTELKTTVNFPDPQKECSVFYQLFWKNMNGFRSNLVKGPGEDAFEFKTTLKTDSTSGNLVYVRIVLVEK